MKEIQNIHEVYFIGIGGIGMSALARYFNSLGKKVSGYDKTETDLTRKLVEEGIAIHYEDNMAMAPKNPDIVVYTPAIPKGHSELEYYKTNGFDILKRSDVLGAITRSSFNICVAGTHGKTTITTMIAHILRDTGYGCNAFLGGIAANYNSNFWSNERNVCVVEADEYDRSFLKLSPDIAVISAMDADHLDIYGTPEAMQEAFVEFSGKVKEGGVLFSKWGLGKAKQIKTGKHFTYSRSGKEADAYAANIRNKEGGYVFNINWGSWKLDDVVLNMGGLHNVENSIVAMAIAHYLEIDDEKIKAAVANFRGVKRRFEYIVPLAGDKGIVYIDDYAHHPAELEALITGAKGLFPDRKCTVIFQPHLFSRTNDFAQEFAESLDLADEVKLLPVYPARELPMPGVTSNTIASKMKNAKHDILNKDDLLSWIKNEYSKSEKGLLITAGAGDIDKLVEPVKSQILNLKF